MRSTKSCLNCSFPQIVMCLYSSDTRMLRSNPMKNNKERSSGSRDSLSSLLFMVRLIKQTMSTGKNVPPRNPRSAFVCFADHKREELKLSKKKVLQIASSLWAELGSTERAHWEEVARNDKLRFVQEKASFQGPWNPPKKRAKKDPDAPKRPMSAFLAFSQVKRKEIKESNPAMENTDISRLLGEMWRTASEKEKEPFVEQEKIDRAKYKEVIAEFRETKAKKDAASRTSHQAAIQDTAPIQQSYRSGDREVWRHCIEPPFDRRIFRSYSGSGHHHKTGESTKSGNNESKVYQERHFPPYYAEAPTPIRSQHHAYAQGHFAYTQSSTSDKARMHPNYYGYRSYQQHENYNHQVPHFRANDSFTQQQSSLKRAESDLSKLDVGQDSFGEPEPEFHSKHDRPSSSRYFADTFHQYS